MLLNVCAGSDAIAPKLRELVADAKALRPIADAMRTHIELPQVLEPACRAIISCCQGNDAAA